MNFLKREPVLENAQWITQYDRSDFLCDYVKHVTKSPMCLANVSLHLKHLEALKDMVDNDIHEAMIFEDDVVFQKIGRKNLIVLIFQIM